jgi:hypothetical protein
MADTRKGRRRLRRRRRSTFIIRSVSRRHLLVLPDAAPSWLTL